MAGNDKKRSVIAMGELLWDVLPNERLLGGAPANYCFRLHQLGVPTHLVSRLGSDVLGDELVAALEGKGLDMSLVQRDGSLPTGTVDVILTAEGNPSFTINKNVAYDNLEATPALLAAAAQCAVVCFGTLAQRTPKARETIYAVLDHAASATKILDINLRKECYTADTVSASLKRCDILKLNVSEVKVISQLLNLRSTNPQEMAREVIDRYDIKTVLITLGEQGVCGVEASGKETTVPGISVKVADTIGSGDSFAAGFTYKFLEGAPLAECCRFGNALGALNASRKGGMPDISRAEIDELLSRYSEAA